MSAARGRFANKAALAAAGGAVVAAERMAQEVAAPGAHAVAPQVDVTRLELVQDGVTQTVRGFGGYPLPILRRVAVYLFKAISNQPRL